MPTLDGLVDVGTSLGSLVDLDPSLTFVDDPPWIVGVTSLDLVTDILDRPGEFVGCMEFDHGGRPSAGS